MTGAAAADFLVCRIRCEATCVTDGRRVNPRQLPEVLLSAPETSEGEHGFLHARGKGWDDSFSVHEMRLGHLQGLLSPGERIGCTRHRRLRLEEGHGSDSQFLGSMSLGAAPS